MEFGILCPFHLRVRAYTPKQSQVQLYDLCVVCPVGGLEVEALSRDASNRSQVA